MPLPLVYAGITFATRAAMVAYKARKAGKVLKIADRLAKNAAKGKTPADKISKRKIYEASQKARTGGKRQPGDKAQSDKLKDAQTKSRKAEVQKMRNKNAKEKGESTSLAKRKKAVRARNRRDKLAKQSGYTGN